MIDFSRFIGFPCAFIIALFAWLVKRFFEVFRKFLDCRCSPFQEPLSLNFCTYYIMPCGVCQEVFSIFFKIFLEPFGVPLLTSVLSIPPPTPEVKNFLSKSCTISGDPKHNFLCSLSIDFLLAVVYNENSARCVRQRAVEEGIVHFDEKKRGVAPLSSSTYPKTRTDFRPCPEM